VQSCAASILLVEQSEIKDTSVLLDFGLDSQKEIELVNYLFKSSQIRLPVVYLMTGKNTVTDIANYFLSKLTKEDMSYEDDFISENPSILELHYLDLYANDSSNPHLIITLDLAVSSEFNSAEIWKTSLLNLILINPGLRTTFQKTEPGQKRAQKRRCVLDIEDVCCDFLIVSSDDELQKVFKEISKFDPCVDIPIKAIFWSARTSGALRLILNHCCIDLGSVLTIVKDLVYIFKYHIIHRCFPELNARESLDPALLIENHVKGEIDELKSFWTTELLKCKKSHSFAGRDSEIETFNNTDGNVKQEQYEENKSKEVTMQHLNSDHIHSTSRVTTTHWSGDHIITKHWSGDHNTSEVIRKPLERDTTTSNVITRRLRNGQKTGEVINHRGVNQNSTDILTKFWNANAFQKLEDSSKNCNFSLFSLFCTAFQLTLYKQLQCQRVCVINAVDARLHFPEFRDRIALCVNYVPLVSPDLTNAESTLSSVLAENKLIIANGISKSLLPFKQIKELQSFRKDIHMAHCIVMEDLVQFKELNRSYVRLTKFSAEQDETYETCLSVIIHPTKSLELRLRYSVGNVGRYNAENILENVEEILLNMMSNLSMKIQTWQPTYKEEQSIEGFKHGMCCIFA
jgi:hypothetical protein